jgi:hypothetical protein
MDADGRGRSLGEADFTWKDYRHHSKTKVMTLGAFVALACTLILVKPSTGHSASRPDRTAAAVAGQVPDRLPPPFMSMVMASAGHAGCAARAAPVAPVLRAGLAGYQPAISRVAARPVLADALHRGHGGGARVHILGAVSTCHIPPVARLDTPPITAAG